MNNIITQEEKNRIDALCKEYNITNYSINNDGTIDVVGSVSFPSGTLTKLPLKFNKVSGHFSCSYNKLTSLEGCPRKIGGDFYFNNNLITSLEYYPSDVVGTIDFDNISLPYEFYDINYKLDYSEIVIFIKYMNYYEVWTPVFSKENLDDLIADIKDGLR